MTRDDGTVDRRVEGYDDGTVDRRVEGYDDGTVGV